MESISIKHSVLPIAKSIAPQARSVRRRTFRPAGKAGPAYTFSLYDDGTYQLTKKEPDKKGSGFKLFAGSVELKNRDLDDVVSQVLEQLTVAPGDIGDEVFKDYTPEQLAFAAGPVGARALRTVVASRLLWSAAVLRRRVDLQVEYAKRAVGDLRHRYTLGSIEVSAHTQAQARALLSDALRNHLSAPPAFVRGEVTGDLYVLYPHGAEWVVQVIEPDASGDAWLGEVLRFAAAGPLDAELHLARLISDREASAGPPIPKRSAQRARRLSDIAGLG